MIDHEVKFQGSVKLFQKVLYSEIPCSAAVLVIDMLPALLTSKCRLRCSVGWRDVLWKLSSGRKFKPYHDCLLFSCVKEFTRFPLLDEFELVGSLLKVNTPNPSEC